MNTYKWQSINSFMTEVPVTQKPAHWFALKICFYMIVTLFMKELRRSSPIILLKSVLTCRKAEWSFFLFFCLGFLSRIFTIHRAAGEDGVHRFHPLHRDLDISRVIAAESSPLCIAGSRTRTGNLRFPNASR